jgi:hypothetical protein
VIIPIPEPPGLAELLEFAWRCPARVGCRQCDLDGTIGSPSGEATCVKKSRRRDPDAVEYGGYMLTDARLNAVMLGGQEYVYNATLSEIVDYLDAGDTTRP